MWCAGDPGAVELLVKLVKQTHGPSGGGRVASKCILPRAVERVGDGAVRRSEAI